MAGRWILWVYPLILLVLTGVAIYEHITASTLSLPISPLLTFLIILLPLLSGLTTTFHPLLTRYASSSPSPSSPSSSSLFRPLLPAILQSINLALASIIVTLLFSQSAVPSAIRSCLLEGRWMNLFRAHDGAAIRRIQDTFDCCGFNTVNDRAWPFPAGRPGDGGIGCAQRYNRQLPCRGPWEKAMAGVGGGDLGVVLAVGFLQVIAPVVMRIVGARSGGDGTAAWPRRLGFGGRRGLITGAEETGRVREREREHERAPLLEEVTDANGEVGGDCPNGVGSSSQSNGYGSAGPRVEPSGQAVGASSHENPWTAGAGQGEGH